jgi:hypothetical protein
MSAQIITLPRRSTLFNRTYRDRPYQRVFRLGYCDFGKPYWCPELEQSCQDEEEVYLKRLRYDKWVFQFYRKGIVREFLWCMTDELEETFQDIGLDDPPTRAELVEMGWRDPKLGKVLTFSIKN